MGHFNINEDKYNESSLLGKRNARGQTNITNSAEEKWALLDKGIEMEDSETENENRNGRTILHHTISLHYNVM